MAERSARSGRCVRVVSASRPLNRRGATHQMRSRTYAGHVVVVLAIAFAGLFSFQERAVADTFNDTGFATETIASFPPFSLVGMAWAPDGRLFVWEKNGV